MPDIISVRFRSEGKQYYFDPQGETCRVGDGVIVETAAGKEYAVCVRGNFTLPEEELTAPLRPLLRLAIPEDRAVVERESRFLLEKARVSVNDGAAFGNAYGQFIRVNFALTRQKLQEALERIRQALDEKA